MTTSQIFIAISIAVLASIALIVFVLGKSRKENRLTSLAAFAVGFVLAGILLGDDRLIGYSLLGAGVILAVIDWLNGPLVCNFAHGHESSQDQAFTVAQLGTTGCDDEDA